MSSVSSVPESHLSEREQVTDVRIQELQRVLFAEPLAELLQTPLGLLRVAVQGKPVGEGDVGPDGGLFTER